jgi:hypothetical protein
MSVVEFAGSVVANYALLPPFADRLSAPTVFRVAFDAFGEEVLVNSYIHGIILGDGIEHVCK